VGFGDMGVFVEMFDPPGIEARRPSFDPMDNVAFLQEKFSEISAILPGHAGNQGDLFFVGHINLSSCMSKRISQSLGFRATANAGRSIAPFRAMRFQARYRHPGESVENRNDRPRLSNLRT
jgi:hypothetical protein